MTSPIVQSCGWPLMAEGITEADRADLAQFILSTDRLTMGRIVREFEDAWSRWLGCRYSVMVNSGSSANLLLIGAIKELNGVSPVVCQAVTWATNISPVVQHGFDLQLVDVDLSNFGPDLSDLDRLLSESGARVVFLTHVLGFSAVTPELLSICERHRVTLLEDCCEAHGASFAGRKAGTFGAGSTFSFYYGHHMSTIEGGMVCTDREDVYRRLLLLRSHGLSRELPDRPSFPGVDPRFTFLLHGYNVRPTELNAFLGLRQLQRLDSAIEQRNRNLSAWLCSLDSSLFYTGFSTAGVSSFALPLLLRPLCRTPLSEMHETLGAHGVESRPIISGNIARQPFLAGYAERRPLPNADTIHDRGLYIGNNPTVSPAQVKRLADLLNREVK